MCFPVRLVRAIEPPDPQRRQARALSSTASERLDDRAPRCRSGRLATVWPQAPPTTALP